jgi:hypothetical protein
MCPLLVQETGHSPLGLIPNTLADSIEASETLVEFRDFVKKIMILKKS